MQTGSLIECVENNSLQLLHLAMKEGLVLPEKGTIYTCDGIDQANKHCLFLVELKQYHPITGEEFSYRISWFRELQPPMDITDELFSYAPESCEA